MKKILFSIVWLFVVSVNYAQGCSDAGICSIAHGFQSNIENYKNNIEIVTLFGAGESDVTYFSPFISYTRKLNEKLSLSTKVTFSTAKGSFGTISAFGDAYLIGNYSFKEKNSKQWSTLVGWKFPFTSSNLKINEVSLPMDYQSSLGTFDLFLGSNFKFRNWDFNTAVQIPIFNNNKNSYFKEYSGADDFPSTNLFERRSDALFRVTYSVKTQNQKFIFKPNLLFIYHLGEDSFENIFGVREAIIGSDGLTINGNLISSYLINQQNSIELSVAAPFVVREIRPDGLTRSFVAGILYKYSF
jgi:hypothetical protein